MVHTLVHEFEKQGGTETRPQNVDLLFQHH